MSRRLLLVDDHRLFRDGIRSLLAYQEDFEVVGEADDAEGGVRQALRLRPDIVLMDIDFPQGPDGIEAAARITAQLPGTSVVMLTVHDDTEKLLDAFKAGASGYLVKSIRSEELLRRLRALSEGEAVLSRGLAVRILAEFRRGTYDPIETELTSREFEVLTLVAQRKSNREIATDLVISENTVKNHMKAILGKLQVRNRRAAAAYGISHGWFAPSEPGRR
jgi:DNA-binding NarL/FixJ family response regulator